MEKENQFKREARAETRGTHVTKTLKVARQQHNNNNSNNNNQIINVMDITPYLHQNNYHTKDTKTAHYKIE